MSNPEANSSELNPFSVVKFATGQNDRVAIIFSDSDQPSKVILAGKSDALESFKAAVETANSFVDAGSKPNAKMIEEHPAISEAKKLDLLVGINPATRKAALEGQAIDQNNDKSPAATTATKNYAFNREDIPEALVNAVKTKLGEKAQVTPPIVDGKYKGKVVYENDAFLVQGVYKKVPEGYAIHNAVAHRKSDLEFLTENHKWRAEQNRSGGQEIRTYYDGDKAKVYPYSLQKELQVRAAKTAGFDVSKMSPKDRNDILESKGVSIPQIPSGKQKSQQNSMER